MNSFKANSGYFSSEILEVTKIPIKREDESINDTAISLIDDLYNICNGNGSVSLEYLRVAHRGEPKVHHFIIIRAFDRNEDICHRINRAATYNIAELLLSGGYVFEVRTYEEFAIVNDKINRESCWAMVKNEIVESDSMSANTHISLPVISDTINMDSLYTILKGAECSISIQITPDYFNSDEMNFIQSSYTSCSRALDGIPLVPQSPRDNIALFGKQRWEYYVKNINSSILTMNILLMGENDRVAILAARLRSKMRDRFTNNSVSMFSIPLNIKDFASFHDYTWKCELAVEKTCRGYNNLISNHSSKALCRKYTSEEVKAIMDLPSDDGTDKGIQCNAFSYLNYNNVLPEKMTQSENAIYIGKTVSGKCVYTSLDELKLHTSIYGKTGVGKTTFMLWLIEQFEQNGINVLILEPIKDEYRVLSKGGKSKVFTVESDVLPFVINPFYVPTGVTLDEYRPHLISAFMAAISMPDPLPSLFGKAVSECYAMYGWKGYSKSTDEDVRVFGLREFVRVFKHVISKSSYSLEVKGNMMSGGAFRIMSLIERGKKTFDNIHSIDIRDILNGIVVLELNKLEGEQKSLITALTMISVLSYLRTTRKSGETLKNILILDEAHVLLDNSSNETEEAKNINSSMTKIVENMVVEIRSQGVGLIIADQSPERLGSRLLNSTDTKILFRLTGEEAKLVANSIGMNENDAVFLNHLDVGEVVFANHDLIKPLGLKVPKSVMYDTKDCVSDKELSDRQKLLRLKYSKIMKPYKECTLCKRCVRDCKYRIRENSYSIATQLYNSCSKNIKEAKDLVQYLLAVSKSIRRQVANDNEDVERLIGCSIIQFYFLAMDEKNIVISETVLGEIIEKSLSNNVERGR